MKIEPFYTERFFAAYEFGAPYLLCASDCQPLTVGELLNLAGVPWDSLGKLALGYTEGQGTPALRALIAGQYEQVGSDGVIVLSAPEEGIFLTMHALLEPGDEVIVLSPCYDSLANVASHLGCAVTRWSLAETPEPPEGPGGWWLDLGALESALTPRTRLVVANFPHNPTGYLPTHGEWHSLVEMVRKNGAWLFSDEMYRGLEYSTAARLTPGCDLYERAITLCGLSKTYGLAGLRVGWLALQDTALRDRVLGWKDYTTICASVPSEALAQMALDIGETLAARNVQIIKENLARAEPFFGRWEGVFRWNQPQAGSVALAGLRSGSATAFCRRLLDEQGVLLLPSRGLGFGDGHVRFGFGRLTFPEALEQLDRYLSGREDPVTATA